MTIISAQPARRPDPVSYGPLSADTVTGYLAGLGAVARRLGGHAGQWRATERGDGNLNLVFIVEGPSGAVVVKQALPYVRMVGESWPLSLTRNHFEHAALEEQGRWVPEFVPALYHTDDRMALTVMEYLSPHRVLRKGLLAAHVYPSIGRHLGRFLAGTLFNTSELRLAATDKKTRMGVFLANTAMSQISEDLIFDEPYFAAPLNRHTAPHLDELVAALRRDAELKLAVQAMKWRFMNQPECLMHGDLHTGSVMVTELDTRVIDAEFAGYGPMGFDVGMLIANLLMAYLSQSAREVAAGDRDAYKVYLLEQIGAIWTTFVSEFSRLWHGNGSREHAGLCNPRLEADAPGFSSCALAWRVRAIWHDALGFMGCEMIRRVVGLAHVEDFEAILDAGGRARCERRAIEFGRELLTRRTRFASIADLVAAASVLE